MKNSRRKFLKSVIIGAGGVVSGLPVLGNSYSIGAYKTPSGAISSFIMQPVTSGDEERIIQEFENSIMKGISAATKIPVRLLMHDRGEYPWGDLKTPEKLEYIKYLERLNHAPKNS